MFKKFFYAQIDFDILKQSMLFSLLFLVLFNTPILLYKYTHYSQTGVNLVLKLSIEVIIAYVALFIIFLGIRIHPIIFNVNVFLLFFSGALASYYLFVFDKLPTGRNINKIFAINFLNFDSYLTLKLVVWLLFSMFVCFYTLSYFKIKDKNMFLSKLLCALCLLITANNIISPQFVILQSFFPLFYLHNIYYLLFG